MPIEYKVYHQEHLVVARCHGRLTWQDMFEYQQTAWARPDLSGYSELVDLTDVTELVMPEVGKAQELANLSASMDNRKTASRFAIFAVTELQFAMGRLYSAWRNEDHRTSKQTQVFRSLPEALEWLGLKFMPKDAETS